VATRSRTNPRTRKTVAFLETNGTPSVLRCAIFLIFMSAFHYSYYYGIEHFSVFVLLRGKKELSLLKETNMFSSLTKFLLLNTRGTFYEIEMQKTDKHACCYSKFATQTFTVYK
jgi:hypothetical protein